MSEFALTPLAGAHRQISWRDKMVPLALYVILMVLLFRPLLWNDARQIFGIEAPAAAQAVSPETTATQAAVTPAPPAAPVLSTGRIWLNTLADLASFALALIAGVFAIVTRIGSIAFNTFKEAVRNRILYLILFFALILMGASGIIKELAIGSQERIIRDLGLASISFFGLMVAIFVGISLVYNELDKRTIYTIVSKPLHRWQFLLGKFFGLLVTVYLMIAIMTVFFFTVVNYQQLTSDERIERVMSQVDAQTGQERVVDNAYSVYTRYLATSAAKSVGMAISNVFGFAYGAVTQNLMIVVAMTCLEMMIVTALAILFSSFTTPTLSAIFTVLTFLAGRLNEDITRLTYAMLEKAIKDQGVNSITELTGLIHFKVMLARIVSVIIPNLDSLNLTSQVVYNENLSVWRYPVLYAFCYTATVLMISIVIFRRRNFK